MNKPLSEQEMLLARLSEIYDQLEELESVLEASFTDLRMNLKNEALTKLTVPKQRIAVLEEKLENISHLPLIDVETNLNQVSGTLKLELGF